MVDPQSIKPPAFQFYPSDFDAGTVLMSPAEVGAYIRLLNFQWLHGAVPGDTVRDLARIIGCAPGQAKALWKTVTVKFIRHDQDVWKNARMERERQKQADYRERQRQHGLRSGEARVRVAPTNPPTNPITNPPTKTEAKGQPQGQPNPNSSSSSLSSIKDLPSVPLKLDPATRGPSERSSSSLLMSPSRFDKLSQSHAFVGSRLRVPFVLHDELRNKLGGVDPTMRLLAWYQEVNAEIDASGEALLDIFTWLRPRFQTWAADAAADAELERFRPKGA